jgi:hypothetical protein
MMSEPIKTPRSIKREYWSKHIDNWLSSGLSQTNIKGLDFRFLSLNNPLKGNYMLNTWANYMQENPLERSV